MIKKLMYTTQDKSGDSEQAILHYIEHLDAENQEAFKAVKKMAKERAENSDKYEMEKSRRSWGWLEQKVAPKVKDPSPDDQAAEPSSGSGLSRRRRVNSCS